VDLDAQGDVIRQLALELLPIYQPCPFPLPQ
jgi:hypothetical protein